MIKWLLKCLYNTKIVSQNNLKSGKKSVIMYALKKFDYFSLFNLFSCDMSVSFIWISRRLETKSLFEKMFKD